MKIFIVALLSGIAIAGYPQQGNTLFTRLRAISNNGTDFFNVDGIEITSQTLDGEFTKKNIAKKFKKYSIRETDFTQSDSAITDENFFAAKQDVLAEGLVRNTDYYFVQTSNGIKAITFGAINKTDKALERELIGLIVHNNIPSSVYEPLNIDSINFAGRNLPLGRSCRWMGVNNVQCPYYGQMN